MAKVKLEEESTNPAKPSPSEPPETQAHKKAQEKFETEFSHIPDIPAQMLPITERSETAPTTTVTEKSTMEPTVTVTERVEIPNVEVSVPISTPPKETEIEFLTRLMKIQEEGGFGRHLDHIIVERIKSLS